MTLLDEMTRRMNEVLLGGSAFSAGGTFSNRSGMGYPTLDDLRYVAQEALKTEHFGEAGVRAFWFSIQSVKVQDVGDGMLELEIASFVPDRDTGAPLGIKFTRKVTKEACATPELKLMQLRAALRAWLMHELDENLSLNGERVFDPHKAAPSDLKPIPPPPIENDPFFPGPFRYYAGTKL